MKKIHIDLAQRTLRRVLYQTKALTWFLGFIGILLCATAALRVQKLQDQLDKKETTLLHMKVKLSERNDKKPDIKKSALSDAQAAAVNGAIAQLNLPWSDLLDAVESATPKTIALLSLEPNAKRNLVKGTAEAKNSEDMIAYVDQLRKQVLFSMVLLSKHEINEQDPNKPFRFQFEAYWRADAP